MSNILIKVKKIYVETKWNRNWITLKIMYDIIQF